MFVSDSAVCMQILNGPDVDIDFESNPAEQVLRKPLFRSLMV
jgi:hypothetical protein